MLACNALREDAISRLFALKGREANKPIHVALAQFSAAADYVQINEASEKVAQAFLPGPVTIVLPKTQNISDTLVAGTGYLGIRIVDNPITQLICAALGAPLTATSLNLSGEAPAQTVIDTVRSLNWRDPEPIYVVQSDEKRHYDKPSTVVRFLTGADQRYEILRQGPISAQDIDAAIHGTL